MPGPKNEVTIGWSGAGIPGRGSTCSKAQGQVRAWVHRGRALLRRGASPGLRTRLHLLEGVHVGQGKARGWRPGRGAWLSHFQGRLHSQQPRAGQRCEWCTQTSHPLNLGQTIWRTSLCNSSGHFSFLSSLPPQRIGISRSP